MNIIYNLKRSEITPNIIVKTFKYKGTLPVSVDWRSKCPPIYNQETLGSCTSNAIIGCVQYTDPTFYGSRLFHYYNERIKDGTVNIDAGSTISRGIEILKNMGVCSENLWPYDIDKYKERPTDECYQKALLHKAISSDRVEHTEHSIKSCLADGYLIAFGVDVYESFQNAKKGNIPYPEVKTEKLLGGHAIVLVGYDDEKQYYIFRNSWGTSWGEKGYGYIPYKFIHDTSLTFDLHQIISMNTTPDDNSDDYVPDNKKRNCCICFGI